MENKLSEILEQYPRSNLNKYGDWFELNFRIEKGPGCFQIRGTEEQVKNSVYFIIERFEKGKIKK